MTQPAALDSGGFWPAEGGVSEAAVRLFSKAGVKWAASGALGAAESEERPEAQPSRNLLATQGVPARY